MCWNANAAVGLPRSRHSLPPHGHRVAAVNSYLFLHLKLRTQVIILCHIFDTGKEEKMVLMGQMASVLQPTAID